MSSSDSTSKDPYDVLKISRDATSSQIKTAYRKLALKYHPDKQTTEEDKARCTEIFTRIGNAYEILSDDKRKRHYDLYGHDDEDHVNEEPGYRSSSSRHHDPFEHHHSFHSSHHFTDPFDLFRQVFQEHDAMFANAFDHHHSEQRHRHRDPFDDPFDDPFFQNALGGSMFGRSMFGGGSMFRNHSSNTSRSSMMSDGFGGGGLGSSMSRQMNIMNSMPGMSSSSSYYSSSSSSSRNGGMGGSSVSTSTSTRIINGKRETVTKRTVVHPDGRVETTTESSSDDMPQHQMIGDSAPSLNLKGRVTQLLEGRTKKKKRNS